MSMPEPRQQWQGEADEEEEEEEKKEEDEDQQNSQKHLECLSDVSWKPVGGLLGRLGDLLAVQGCSWASWVPRGPSWGRLGSSWGAPGALLGPLGGLLGASWGQDPHVDKRRGAQEAPKGQECKKPSAFFKLLGPRVPLGACWRSRE